MRKLLAVLLTLLFSVPFYFLLLVSFAALPIQSFNWVFFVFILATIVTVTIAWVLLNLLIGRKHDIIFYLFLVLFLLVLGYASISNFQIHSYNPSIGQITLSLTLVVGVLTFFSILKRKKSREDQK